MSFLSFLLGQRNVRLRRQGAAADHPGPRAGPWRSPDYLPQLQQELIAVISKYVKINPEDIKVHLERQDTLEVLEVKIEMPQGETSSPNA